MSLVSQFSRLSGEFKRKHLDLEPEKFSSSSPVMLRVLMFIAHVPHNTWHLCFPMVGLLICQLRDHVPHRQASALSLLVSVGFQCV